MGFGRAIPAAIIFLAIVCMPTKAGQANTVPAIHVQEPRPPSPYFSGYVIELKPDSIVVSRKASTGKTSIQRVFLMDPQTKVEGKLKVNSRVTVRFEALGEAHRAIHIIVR